MSGSEPICSDSLILRDPWIAILNCRRLPIKEADAALVGAANAVGALDATPGLPFDGDLRAGLPLPAAIGTAAFNAWRFAPAFASTDAKVCAAAIRGRRIIWTLSGRIACESATTFAVNKKAAGTSFQRTR